MTAPTPCPVCRLPTQTPTRTGCCQPCGARLGAEIRAAAALIWELAPLTTPTPLDTTAHGDRAGVEVMTEKDAA